MQQTHATADIQEAIRDYITSSFLADDDAATFRNDDDLLTILDSLQILRMLIDLEGQFSIKVDNSELSPENLGSVEKLAAFVARKQTDLVG